MTRACERRGGQSAARWVLGCGELRALLDENDGTVWCLALSHHLSHPQTPEQLAPGRRRSFLCVVPAELGLKNGRCELHWETLF